MSRIDKYLGEKKITEAEEVKFVELEPDKQKSILKIVDKSNVKSAFSGIHGDIVMLTRTRPDDVVRIDKRDIKKLAQDKNIRWIEISTIAL